MLSLDEIAKTLLLGWQATGKRIDVFFRLPELGLEFDAKGVTVLDFAELDKVVFELPDSRIVEVPLEGLTLKPSSPPVKSVGIWRGSHPACILIEPD